ncbi:MAG: phenylpropionate dioxygenase-like ring-hydroxylating dioxygenase large terminal subunit [Gammaproteobacteria bacterium]|jgi:phenylpropionate dioxygenase-like ring-hydroxylating dioxygenase large terminal subunit
MSFTLKDFDPSVPNLGNGPVSSEPYVSAAYFARERDNIYGKVWLNVGRAIEIPKPGNFVVKSVEIRNASVLITRGKDNVVRAFHNVCSHRASKVEWRTQGSSPVFTCPYHAWTYDLEGALRSVPADSNFIGLDKKQCGLTPIACNLWNDLIFINLDPNPSQSLREYLGPIAAYGDAYPFADMDSGVTLVVPEVRCNWKIFMDAFQELYHINVLHKQTLKTTYSGPTNPYSDPLYFRTYGPHRSLSFGFNVDHAVGPVERMSQRFATDLTSSAAAQTSQITKTSCEQRAGLNPTNAPNWAFDLNTIFPNTVWLAGSGSTNIHRFWPITEHTTRYESTIYNARPQRVSERFARELRFGLFRDTVVEDILNTELCQQALLSGAKQQIYLQDGEVSIRHHLHAIDSYVQHGEFHA